MERLCSSIYIPSSGPYVSRHWVIQFIHHIPNPRSPCGHNLHFRNSVSRFCLQTKESQIARSLSFAWHGWRCACCQWQQLHWSIYRTILFKRQSYFWTCIFHPIFSQSRAPSGRRVRDSWGVLPRTYPLLPIFRWKYSRGSNRGHSRFCSSQGRIRCQTLERRTGWEKMGPRIWNDCVFPRLGRQEHISRVNSSCKRMAWKE